MLLLAKVMKITESQEQMQSIFGASIISARTWVFHFLGGVKLKAKGSNPCGCRELESPQEIDPSWLLIACWYMAADVST